MRNRKNTDMTLALPAGQDISDPGRAGISFYARHFRKYHQKTVSIDPSFLQPFVDRLEKGSSVLDVGCGSGRDLRYLQKNGLVVTGLDISPGLVELARIHGRCTVIQGDIETYPFESLNVDAILLSAALVHVPHNRMENILLHILKALGPKPLNGGLVYLSLKAGHGTVTDETGRMFYLWEDHALRSVFNRCGLSVLYSDRNESAIGTGDTWLGYVLQKGKS